MNYHAAGIISAVMSSLALAGVVVQLRLIRRRRMAGHAQRSTDVLSVNRFATSCLIFLSLLVYGAMLPRFNHYLVWPRVAAVAIVLAILQQVMADRRDAPARWGFAACVMAALAAGALAALRPPMPWGAASVSNWLVVITSVVYVQGAAVQIAALRRHNRPGGLSAGMHLLFLLKDLANLLFALVMGTLGWPLALISCVGIVVNVATLVVLRQVRGVPSDIVAAGA